MQSIGRRALEQEAKNANTQYHPKHHAALVFGFFFWRLGFVFVKRRLRHRMIIYHPIIEMTVKVSTQIVSYYQDRVKSEIENYSIAIQRKIMKGIPA